MTELNEYVVSTFEEYHVYTKIWAKTEEDAQELLYGGGGDFDYEAPEPVVIRKDYWNGSDVTNVVRVNGEYAVGYKYMEENGYLDGTE